MNELTDLFRHWLEQNNIILLLDKESRAVGALFPSRVDVSKLVVLKSNDMQAYDYFIELNGLGIYFSKYKKIS